jgi:hypothetical protein
MLQILLPADSDAKNQGANERPGPSLTELAKVGGPPFALIAIAVANFEFGTSQNYTETEQVIVSSVLFVAGIFAWLLGMILEYKRWKLFSEINAKREATTIEAICRVIESKDQETARELIQIILCHSRSFATNATWRDNALRKTLEDPEHTNDESTSSSKSLEA